MGPKVGGFEEAWNRDGFAPGKFKNRIVDRDILVKDGIDPDQFIREIRHVSPTSICGSFKLSRRQPAICNRALVSNLASGFPDTLLHESLCFGRQAGKR